MNLLTELADRYGTDKGSRISFHGVGKNHPHFFTEVYNQFFESLRFSVRSIFEIGLYGGGSVRMWQDYFPNATIYGIDYQDKFLIQQDRIKTYCIDQNDEDALNDLCTKNNLSFDIIIDDGSHDIFDQQKTFAFMFPKLNRSGFYVIEDLHTSCNTYSEFLDKHGVDENFKYTPLNILKTYQQTNKFYSPIIDAKKIEYIQSNIDNVKLFDIHSNRMSITSIIKKK
jgi:hypothetical protein